MLRWLVRVGTSILASLALLGAGAVPAALAQGADGDQHGNQHGNQHGRPHTYLALGDSVPFGYDPQDDPGDASNFVGYPEVLAERLGYDLTNASCPGEASGGFVSLDGGDNSCRPYRAAFPLHTSYESAQLEFATDFLERHRRTKLITLSIGANDLFVCESRPEGCTPEALQRTLADLRANLHTIYGEIRDVYRHQLVALTYYALDYRDQQGLSAIRAANRVIASVTREYGGTVADGFGAFREIAVGSGGSSCAAGLLIELSDGTCDIHPSERGREILASAVSDVLRPGTAPGVFPGSLFVPRGVAAALPRDPLSPAANLR